MHRSFKVRQQLFAARHTVSQHTRCDSGLTGPAVRRLIKVGFLVTLALFVNGCASNRSQPESDKPAKPNLPSAQSPASVSQPHAKSRLSASAGLATPDAGIKQSKAPFLNLDDIDELARRYARLRSTPESIQSVIAANRVKVIDKYHKLILAPDDVGSIDLTKMRPGYPRRYLELIYWADKSTKRTFVITFFKRSADAYWFKVVQDGEAGEFLLRSDTRSRTLQDSLLVNVNAYLTPSEVNRDHYTPNACEFQRGACQYQWATGDNPQTAVVVKTSGDYSNYIWTQMLSIPGAEGYKVESVFDKQGLLLHRAVTPQGKNKKYIAKEWVRIE